jgi:hypothetical protein
MTPDDLIQQWADALASRNAADRERLLRSCCADGVEFIPPDERPVIRGIDALVSHLSEFTSGWSQETTVRVARPVEAHHGWCRGLLLFDLGDRKAQGTEIARIEDGKIQTLLVFSDTKRFDQR